MGAPTFKPTVNVPFLVTARYATIYKSTNPEYDPQVCLKGRIDKEPDARVYLPLGALPALKAAGVIKEVPDLNMQTIPDNGLSLILSTKQFCLTRSQAPGERSYVWKVETEIGGPAKVSGDAQASSGTSTATQGGLDAVLQRYSEITDFVLWQIMPKYKTKDLGMTATDAKEMVATIMIASNAG